MLKMLELGIHMIEFIFTCDRLVVRNFFFRIFDFAKNIDFNMNKLLSKDI